MVLLWCEDHQSKQFIEGSTLSRPFVLSASCYEPNGSFLYQATLLWCSPLPQAWSQRKQLLDWPLWTMNTNKPFFLWAVFFFFSGILLQWWKFWNNDWQGLQKCLISISIIKYYKQIWKFPLVIGGSINTQSQTVLAMNEIMAELCRLQDIYSSYHIVRWITKLYTTLSFQENKRYHWCTYIKITTSMKLRTQTSQYCSGQFYISLCVGKVKLIFFNKNNSCYINLYPHKSTVVWGRAKQGRIQKQNLGLDVNSHLQKDNHSILIQ